jgi:hypothetical protein
VKNLNCIRVFTSLVVSNETVTIQFAQNTATHQSHNPNQKDVTKHSAIGLQKENSCFLLDLQQEEAFICTTLNSSFITEVFVWLEFSKPVSHQ